MRTAGRWFLRFRRRRDLERLPSAEPLRGPDDVITGAEGQLVLVDEPSQAAVIEADEDFEAVADVAALAGLRANHGALGCTHERAESAASEGCAENAADNRACRGACTRIASVAVDGLPHILDATVEHPIARGRLIPLLGRGRRASRNQASQQSDAENRVLELHRYTFISGVALGVPDVAVARQGEGLHFRSLYPKWGILASAAASRV